MRLDSFNDRLSAKELLDISQEISKDFSPVFETKIVRPKPDTTSKLSRKELFEISEDISRKFQFPAVSVTQSNTLVLLPVDPSSMYAYWDVATETVDITEKTPKSQLTLRVYDAPQQDRSAVKKSWQDMPIQDKQRQQKIRLPVLMDNTAYSVAIGEHHSDGRFITFVHSNPVDAYPANTRPYQSLAHESGLQTKSKNTDKNASGLGSHQS
jgi:hypothetical protein